jgi:thioesterase domain-containing protein
MRSSLNKSHGGVPGSATQQVGLPASLDIEAIVMDIWERVLERGPAARHASILDLKVGLLRVHRLLAEIEKATGVVIPITALFKVDTVEKLVAVIRSGVPLHSEPLAELKAGNTGTPLFFFPGISGVALELAQLGRLIRYDGAIYANQPRGLDGAQPPDRTVAEMAAYAFPIVRSAQPHGPYRIAGYSCGGLVAIEVARKLIESGEGVDFLGLMEPSLPERQWPWRGRMDFFWRRSKHHASVVRALSPRDRKAYLVSHAEPTVNRLRRMLGAKVVGSSPYHRPGLPAGLAETREAGWAAIQSHHLKPYPGKATLFVSEKGNPLGCNTLLAYPKYLRAWDVRRFSGDHSGMLREPHVRELARQISISLAEIDSTMPHPFMAHAERPQTR